MNKKEYYLNIAREVAKRSKCLKTQYGAVLVKKDSILGTGYNGPARGVPHCKKCHRMNDEGNTSAYDMSCSAVHAEENAIIHAARHGTSVEHSTLYLYGECPPCQKCARALINAGIHEVITQTHIYTTKDLYDLAGGKFE